METSCTSSLNTGGRTADKCLTRRLSGIHAAWHFWFAVSFCGESGMRKLGLCGIHPLTQR
ncbi:DUF3265 domain-containing protein [Vibrio cholerae]|nr:DUF3265 domain-containing protein [Vibrio cholerae]